MNEDTESKSSECSHREEVELDIKEKELEAAADLTSSAMIDQKAFEKGKTSPSIVDEPPIIGSTAFELPLDDPPVAVPVVQSPVIPPPM